MDITILDSGEVKIVALEGKLNTSTSPDLEADLKLLLEDGAKKILFDLSDLAFTSSSGLRVIMATGISLQGVEGEIRVCALNDVVADIFDMSGLDTMFKVFETKEAALADF